MRPEAELSDPLDSDEVESLDGVFTDVDIEWATGFLSAIHTGPELVQPSTWLPVLFGEEPPFRDVEEAPSVFGLVMRFYNAIGQTLRLDATRLVPDADDVDAVAEFCSGYVHGARLHSGWWDDETAVAPVIVFAALAGEVEGAVLGLDEKPRPEHEAWERKHRERVAAYVADVHAYWVERRRLPRERTKLGRNDPCPCGSGKKYKRCCAVA